MTLNPLLVKCDQRPWINWVNSIGPDDTDTIKHGASLTFSFHQALSLIPDISECDRERSLQYIEMLLAAEVSAARYHLK